MIFRLRERPGFTVTELTISTVIAATISVITLTVVIVFYGSILRSDVRSRLTVDSQIILRNIVDELRVASNVRDTNTINDTYAPSGGWQTDSNNAILIIAQPVLDNDGEFIMDPNTGEPYENEIIYFAEGNYMYRRVLANPEPAENNLKTTCPEEEATASCLPDGEVSPDYELMNFVFYDQDDNVTTNTDLAESIEMEINLSRDVFGDAVRTDNNIRVTLRN